MVKRINLKRKFVFSNNLVNEGYIAAIIVVVGRFTNLTLYFLLQHLAF